MYEGIRQNSTKAMYKKMYKKGDGIASSGLVVVFGLNRFEEWQDIEIGRAKQG